MMMMISMMLQNNDDGGEGGSVVMRLARVLELLDDRPNVLADSGIVPFRTSPLLRNRCFLPSPSFLFGSPPRVQVVRWLKCAYTSPILTFRQPDDKFAMSRSPAVMALRQSFGDRKPPDITRKITACVACRKLKVGS